MLPRAYLLQPTPYQKFETSSIKKEKKNDWLIWKFLVRGVLTN